MYVFVNGFWPDFLSNSPISFNVFEHILSKVFETQIRLTKSMLTAHILLESHEGQSVLKVRKWKYSFFFSGEGSFKLPPHAEEYTAVLGALRTRDNFVKCPVFLLYELCRPVIYPVVTSIPPKGICALITSDINPVHKRYRGVFIDELMKRGIRVDMGGKYKNNIGYVVPGTFDQQPTIDFLKQYRLVLALENTKLDEYITEKVTNPLRAGTIPVYYGSDRVTDYIHAERIVRVNQDDIEQTVSEIQRLCTDDAYWMEKATHPIFTKTVKEMFDAVVHDIISLLQ